MLNDTTLCRNDIQLEVHNLNFNTTVLCEHPTVKENGDDVPLIESDNYW